MRNEDTLASLTKYKILHVITSVCEYNIDDTKILNKLKKKISTKFQILI